MTSGTETLTVALPVELVDAIDRRIAAMRADDPHEPYARTDAVYEALLNFYGLTTQPVPVHACPEGASGTTPCCGKSPFELLADRMTLDPALVTCNTMPVT